MKAPNLHQQGLRFGARCVGCAHYYERTGVWGQWGRCGKFDRGVLPNDVCDDWERMEGEDYTNPYFV